MRIFIVFYFLALGVLALVAQMILAPNFRLLSDLGIGWALLPLLVIYASMELGDERALILAGLLGLLLDLTSHSHRLGISVLILTSISALIISQTHRPEAHSWLFRISFVLVGTFAFGLMDYFFHLVQSGNWRWPLSVWSKITFGVILNLALCPLVFLGISLPARLCGWRPSYERSESHRDYA